MAQRRQRNIRIIVSGCCGRMGQRIVALAQAAPGIDVVGAVERRGHAQIGGDIGTCAGIGAMGIPITTSIAQVARRGDVVIEFATHAAVAAHARAAADVRCAMVIGTTGITPSQRQAIRRAARRIPVLLAPNMSLGVNLLFQLASQVAAAFGDTAEVDIIEAHHSGKQDAPSGTAVRLGELIAAARKQQYARVAVHGRCGQQPRQSSAEIGMHAVRVGDVVGDHQVIFATPGERLELTHRATSRDTFVHGALAAARWIAKKSPGMYDMSDVLGRV